MSNHNLDRRSFLAVTGTAAAASLAAPAMARAQSRPTLIVAQPDDAAREGTNHRGTCVISSGNGLPATDKAMAMIKDGNDPVDAVVAGVNIVESDPNDMSVGYGGLPNENCIVQLDSCVMHGPTHKAGAVAAIEDIMNPASVALLVLKRTDHVMIVGQGAKQFALRHGFKEENLLTEKARQAWLRWKENLNSRDDWLDHDQMDWAPDGTPLSAAEKEVPFTYGTINCSAVDGNGDLASVTTTSGLSYKIPGRVGDSPIVGAGMFVDNFVGAAGATGRGEAVIQNCGAFSIVREMENGLSPTEACLEVLKRIADRTKQKRLLDEKGRPNFGVTFYAVRKDGAYGSATMWKGGTHSVHDGKQNRKLASAFLFERD